MEQEQRAEGCQRQQDGGIPVLKIFNFALSVTPKSGFPILDSDLLIASLSDENSVDVIKSL